MVSKLPVTLLALLSFNAISTIIASPCIVFDANFNLLVLGLGGKDFDLGQQSTWTTTGSATDITATGRPPFDAANSTCYLSQFFNAIYVMNGDNSNPSNVGIYDATSKSWTTQQVTTAASGSTQAFDPTSFDAILDHDTNVFYALSQGSLFFLDFGQMTAANATALPWTAVGNPSFTTTGYQPVMALAQNHIHFLDVPGAQPGTAQIFVIHFSFFQADPQSYPINGSSNNFPETNGQASSFFQTSGVQQEFAFIPDDHSQTYIINVESNTTASLAGPSDKSTSTFYAGITSLVQLTSAGDLFFLPYTQDDAATNSAAQWAAITLTGLPAANSTSPSSASPSGTGSSGQASSAGKSTPTGSSAGSSATTGAGSSTSNADNFSIKAIRSLGVAGLFVAIGFML